MVRPLFHKALRDTTDGIQLSKPRADRALQGDSYQLTFPVQTTLNAE
jgi:hypothetical protein